STCRATDPVKWRRSKRLLDSSQCQPVTSGCRMIEPRKLMRKLPPTVLVAICFILTASCEESKWQPAAGPLKTRWAKDVSPANVLPEYPRPQMVRKEWMNLNGLWDLAITNRAVGKPGSFTDQILVPFPVESALSGVMKIPAEDQQIWYR